MIKIIVQVLVSLIMIANLVNFIHRRRNRRFYQLIEQFPSYPRLPLIGNAHLLIGSLDGILARGEKRMEPYDRLVYWLGPIPCVCLKKHDDIATVLTQSNDREIFGALDTWLGVGIISARYNEWKKSRKMFAPAFSSGMLTKYVQVFNTNSANLVKKLESVADTGEIVDISHIMMTASLHTIIENSIGVRFQKGAKTEKDFCSAILECFSETVNRFQWPFLLSHNVYMIYLKITGKIRMIHELQRLPAKLLRDNLKNVDNFQCSNVVNHRDDDEDSSKTMLDLLIKKGMKEFNFTESRLRDELLQMIVAGTETTALALSFLTLMLAINQDVQQKVYEEITQLTADDHTLTENHLTNNLEYLEQCIKETIRMYSPGIVTGRRIHKDIILKDNAIIPANTVVVAFIYLSNYDADLYENPQKWDPERFSEQEVKKRPKTSQLGFGYGPRSCIGTKYAMMSMKAQITYILRHYHLSTNIKEFTKEHVKSDFSIRSRIGFPVKFATRQKK